MKQFALWHTKEKRWITLFDLQRPCPKAAAIYSSEEDARFDIENRLEPKSQPFVEIHRV